MAHTRPPVWAIVAFAIGIALVSIAAFELSRPSEARDRERVAVAVVPARAPVRGPARGAERLRYRDDTTRVIVPAPVDLAPVSVDIPGIGARSPLIRLGLNADNTLEVPKDFALAGWYIYRSVPGEPGPSVIAGHVDSRSGPGVFYRLRELGPGALVDVTRSDRSIARFTVTGTEQVDKDQFPTDRVYGPTSGAELRLITCGGSFNWSTRHYEDNLIVYATLLQIIR